MWVKGERIKSRSNLVVGQNYCIIWRHQTEPSCTIASFIPDTNFLNMVLFRRNDLPSENSPEFNPYEPVIIGGEWRDIRIYKVSWQNDNSNSNNNYQNNINNDPTNVTQDPRAISAVNANDPTVGGRRRSKFTRRRRTGTKKRVAKYRNRK